MRLSFCVLLSVLMFYSVSGYAYDKQTVVFKAGDEDKNTVRAEFYGEIFEPILPIFSDKFNEKKQTKNKKTRDIILFFKKIASYGIAKDKKGILSLWHPKDRESKSKLLGDDYFIKFSNLENSRLTMIMEYGEYYLCYILHGKERYKHIVVNVLKEQDNQLLLTNDLDDDAVFNLIAFNLNRVNQSLWLKLKNNNN